MSNEMTASCGCSSIIHISLLQSYHKIMNEKLRFAKIIKSTTNFSQIANVAEFQNEAINNDKLQVHT